MPETHQTGFHEALTFSRPGRRVRALYQGHLIADTGAPLVCHEGSLEDVVYFPRDDVEMVILRPVATREDAGKGTATIYNFMRDGVWAEGGAWSYNSENIMAAELANMVAFDPKVVTLEVYEDETDEMWRKQQQEMSNYIRHTDSGSGLSQAEKWEATVGTPDEAERDSDLRNPPGGLS